MKKKHARLEEVVARNGMDLRKFSRIKCFVYSITRYYTYVYESYLCYDTTTGRGHLRTYLLGQF